LSDISIVSSQKEKLLTKEIKTTVRKAIYALPEKQREVFILSFYLDMTYAEIMDTTGFSISSIESLLFRARKNLRDYLQDFYDEIIS